MWCLLYFLPLLTGHGEPLPVWRLSVLSLLQLLCSVGPVFRPAAVGHSGLQSLSGRPQPELLPLSHDAFLSSCSRWIEISRPRVLTATGNRPEWLGGRSWSWLTWFWMLIWEQFLSDVTTPAPRLHAVPQNANRCTGRPAFLGSDTEVQLKLVQRRSLHLHHIAFMTVDWKTVWQWAFYFMSVNVT